DARVVHEGVLRVLSAGEDRILGPRFPAQAVVAVHEQDSADAVGRVAAVERRESLARLRMRVRGVVENAHARDAAVAGEATAVPVLLVFADDDVVLLRAAFLHEIEHRLLPMNAVARIGDVFWRGATDAILLAVSRLKRDVPHAPKAVVVAQHGAEGL